MKRIVSLSFLAFSCFVAGTPPRSLSGCPRGLSGAACDAPAWPACTVDKFAGDCRVPNSCACADQCDAHSFLHREFRVCYNVTWSPTLMVDDLVSAPVIKYTPRTLLPQGMPDCGLACEPPHALGAPAHADPRDRLVPLHMCPNRCSGRGLCFAGHNGGTCRCFWNDGAHVTADAASGEDCSGSVPLKPCPNACSDAGTCVNGVCTCRAGRAGPDCGAEAGDADATQHPLIYVYDLPPAFNAWHDLVAVDRNLGWHLWQALLRSSHRTHEASRADYFFVPVWPMGTVGLDVAAAAFTHIIHKEPHWNATSGHNHLVVFPYDFAACQMMRLPYFERIRVIGHYGLLRDGPPWCTQPPYAAPAYRPGIDVLVPDTMEMMYKQRSPYISEKTLDSISNGRPITLFFAGSRSGPLRARLFDMHLQEKGFRIVEGHVDLAGEMRAAVFCLDAGAAGFSTRFTLALVMGCVPVWIDEGVVPAWTDVLEIETFSVRVSVHEMLSPGGLRKALDAASQPERLDALRAAGARVWRRFCWSFLMDVGPEDALSTLYERLGALKTLF